MDTIKNNLSKVLDNMDDMSYMSVNGVNVILTTFAIVVVILRITYLYIKSNATELQKNWDNVRCYPLYMPFAGIIKPIIGQTTSQTTSTNFSFCMNKILDSLTYLIMKPLYSSANVLGDIIKLTIENARKIRNKIQERMKIFVNVFTVIIQKIKGMMVPMLKVMLNLKDAMAKAYASAVTSMYTLIATYITGMSFLRNFLRSMQKGMFVLCAAIATLLAFVFTAPAAAPLLAVFGVVYGLLLTISSSLANILGESAISLPSRPCCFGSSTEIEMYDGCYKTIDMIEPGDITRYDGRVNTVIQVDAKTQTIYYIPKIDAYISGTHQINYHKRWYSIKELYDLATNERAIIQASGGERVYSRLTILKCDGKEHPAYTGDYLYCLNTESGYIRLGRLLFSDWNDIANYEYQEMSDLSIHTVRTPTDIHKFFEGGFAPYTQIQLHNGTTYPINRVKIGDTLICGSKVIGVVEAYCKDIELYKHNIYDKVIHGSNNNIMILNYNDASNNQTNLSPRHINHVIPTPPQTSPKRKHSIYKRKQDMRKCSDFDNCDMKSGEYSISIHGFRKAKMDSSEYPQYINHLITDTGHFCINGIRFSDYYSCTENYLQEP